MRCWERDERERDERERERRERERESERARERNGAEEKLDGWVVIVKE